MSVLLKTSRDLPPEDTYTSWIVIGPVSRHPEIAKRLGNLSERLEHAFDAIAPIWLTLGHTLGQEPSASYAHTPVCAANVSDFGLMLAWSKIVAEEAASPGPKLVISDDPWMFRHLSRIEGLVAGSPPPLMFAELKLALRGFAARSKCAFDLCRRAFALRRQQKYATPNAKVLLVYGHPTSTADGQDGYFDALMKDLPDLDRILHVDCSVERARELEGNGRTVSLHAWGSVMDAIASIFTRWKPQTADRFGEGGWLVRRAAALENGTAQGAMIFWQQRCQRRWLAKTKPQVVAWPWENHSWERQFVRAARAFGVRTIGYQHSVIGNQMLNYSPASNSDGLASIPDRIICTGMATWKRLLKWGIPEQRLQVGGALRTPEVKTLHPDPGGPVFIALPFDGETARQMIAAARKLTGKGFNFLIKDHPMSPFLFISGSDFQRTDRPFYEQGGLRAVLYAASTVGLEAALAGLPTVRFRPEGRLSLNILPEAIDLPVAEAENLEQILLDAAPPTIDRKQIFLPATSEFWKRTLLND